MYKIKFVASEKKREYIRNGLESVQMCIVVPAARFVSVGAAVVN